MSDSEDFPATVDRTLTLLWRDHLPQLARRGPKQRLTVDEVVTAGIALADAEGLASFSVRKVAERLGVSVMTLYTYVPGKSELIGLMLDQVMGETELPEHQPDLRQRIHLLAEQIWAEAHRHPWVLQADVSRPWIGPHASARYEWQLSALEGLGFTDIEMDQVLAMVVGLAESCARGAVAAAAARESSGMSDLEWWQINAPVLERVMPYDKYPVSGRVGQAVGEAFQSMTNQRATLDFALDLLADGVERRLLGREQPGG